MSDFRRQLNKYQSAILTNNSIGNNVTDFQKFLVKDFQKLIVLLDWIKGSSQHKVGGEWFEIKLGKISRMLVKYEVLPIPNVIFVC